MKYLFIVAVLLLNSYMEVNAATGEILDNEIAAAADLSVLRAEAKLFESIRQGVVLTITECELLESCSLNVNQDELRQLIAKLDARITSIAARHSESSGEEGLEDILLAYVDARDGYNDMLEKLAALPQTQESKADDFAGEEIFGDVETESTGVENKEEIYKDLFEDIDEEL